MKPIVKPVPLNNPIPESDLRSMIEQGWELWGQAIVELSPGGVATMDNPEGHALRQPCHILVRNPLKIPAAYAAQILLESESKDDLCESLFGMTLEQLQQEMEAT